jgi:DNA-binding transcriptional LysR family regulator
MNRSIDIRQLRYFIAVAEERSYRRAAERLHITQPPLSRQITELETALGTPLLVRNTRSVRLTPAGQTALESFSDLVRRFDAAVARVAGSATELPRLRLALLSWFDMKGLPAFERELKRSGRAIGVEVSTATSLEAITRVHRGELDAALVAGPTAMRGLPNVVVGRIRLAAFVPRSSALAQRRTLSLQDLNRVPPFFRFRRGSNTFLYDHFDEQYRSLGFRPARESDAPDALGVLAQIGAGRGCTIMPEPLLKQRHPGVVGRRLREMVTVDMAMVTSTALAAPLRTAVENAARLLIAGVPGSI